jgi:6-phosphogluconolactonase
MNVRIFDSPEDLAQAAARTIAQRVEGIERPSIAVSGGSTPKALYEILGRAPYRGLLEKKKVTWVVVDERYVPPGDPQSNARMIRETLFAFGVPSSHRFLDFKTAGDDANVSAREFEEEWRRLQLTALDVIVLGVGDDGHTASLFPGTEALEVSDRIATAVFVPRLNQWRVTLTLPVIREAGLRMVLAAGESKAAIIREVKEGADHPIARATAGLESWWFVDEAAARNIK